MSHKPNPINQLINAALPLALNAAQDMIKNSMEEEKKLVQQRKIQYNNKLQKRKEILINALTDKMEKTSDPQDLEQLTAMMIQILNCNLNSIPSFENIFQNLLQQKAEEDKKISLKFKDFKREILQSTCAICIEEYKEDDIIEIRHCSHKFHKKCLASWENSDRSNRKLCPCCRKD
jgi:hypothetical protein